MQALHLSVFCMILKFASFNPVAQIIGTLITGLLLYLIISLYYYDDLNNNEVDILLIFCVKESFIGSV